MRERCVYSVHGAMLHRLVDGVHLLVEAGDMAGDLGGLGRMHQAFDVLDAAAMLLALLGAVRLAMALPLPAHCIAPVGETLRQRAVQSAFGHFRYATPLFDELPL